MSVIFRDENVKINKAAVKKLRKKSYGFIYSNLKIINDQM